MIIAILIVIDTLILPSLSHYYNYHQYNTDITSNNNSIYGIE